MCEGTGAGWGGFAVCCQGAWVACVAVGGFPAAWRGAAASALAMALWGRSAGRGRSKEEVEELDEDEDEEEVVFLGDVGCAAMRAGAASWAAAASAAATAGRMSSGRGLGAGGWGGPAVTWQPGGPIRSAAVGGGGAGLRSPPSGLGWAGLLQCVRACGLVSARGNSSRGLHSGAVGGRAWGLGAVCGVCVWVTGRDWCVVGLGAPRGECVRVAGVGGGEGCSVAGSVAGWCGCLGG